MSQMLPEDLMAMMGGGGDPAAGGALPPDLMAMMGGGAAPPAEESPSGITDGEPGGGEEALIEALDMLQVAIDAEADQEDVQVMLQCQAKLQQILAKNQSEADAALGGKVSPKAIRKMAPAAEGGY